MYPLEQAGLMDKVWPILTKMKGRMIHDLDGNESFQSYGQKSEEVIYSVSRGELNKICLDAAEATGLVTIYFDKKCLSVNFDNHLAEIQDQKSEAIQKIPFKRIIGCDGSVSAVRDAIHKVTSKQLDILPLGHSYKELHIPAGKQGEFQIDKNSLHIWPRGGFMLIALPNSDGSFTVTLFMPSKNISEQVSFEALNSKQKVTDFFNVNFPDTSTLLPQLETEFFSNPTGHLATVKCSPWHFKDKALLLGDAAHAVVPFHGQGMNCGFEDALVLAQTIQQHSATRTIITTKGNGLASSFAQVDKFRKINADAIADMAIENYITMRDSVRDKKFLLRSSLAFELENRFPEHFCPRYSMVMFHRLPYSEAKERGIIQEKYYGS
ncbi:MAG: NAD(P)/FAD-dependent oxidoreductase [Enterobacterales bacterium]|nr:NAD(P)/FAD-dependent oxidoreductase [Enterobacterales bacterium]